MQNAISVVQPLTVSADDLESHLPRKGEVRGMAFMVIRPIMFAMVVHWKSSMPFKMAGIS